MMVQRLLTYIFVFTLVVVAAQQLMMRAMPGEETVTQATLVFGVAFMIVHAPLFLGWTVPPLVVRSIDYIWVGLSAVSAIFAYMSYQGATLERERSAAVQEATSLLDAIDAQMVKIETVCTARALSLIRNPALIPYDGEHCSVEWWITEEIAKKRADQHYPLAVEAFGGGYRQSDFANALTPPENLARLQRLEAAMKWPLIKQMKRFGEVTSAGLNARNQKSSIDGSPYSQPRLWVYLVIVAVAVRLAKTSYEIAADAKALENIKAPWRMLMEWFRQRFA